MRRLPLVGLLLLGLAGFGPAGGPGIDRFFTASDGVRLHYIEAGPKAAHTIVLVPGWTMPAWIFGPQIAALSRRYHVVAFDPRGQGDSEIAATGYEPVRRGQDIADLIATLGSQQVVVLGWSLGVLDTLAYVRLHGDAHVAGLILVDNSIGEEPPPVYRPGPPHPRVVSRDQAVARLVRSMFNRPPGAAYLDALTQACLRTPPRDSAKLLAYPEPRTFWRDAVYSTRKPILYAIRPQWEAQAANLVRKDSAAEAVVFRNAGHALFVDDAARFDAVVEQFLRTRVWP